ncbi:La-related protein 6B [Linum perenne]
MAQEGAESAPETLETRHQSSTSPVDSPTDSAADPSLSRTGSFSKLNARAPEFVPSTTARPQQPPAAPPPARLSVIPPPAAAAAAAAMMHMYPPANSPPPPAVTPPSPYHVQIHSPVPVAHVIPVQNHHHRPHHHNQLQQPQQQYVAVRNHNNHHHHHHFAQNAHYVPVQGHANQNHHYGPVSKKVQLQSEEGEQSEIGSADHGRSKNDRTDRNGFDDSLQKLLNQVEYYFSDLNLATTDHLMRFINKDPDGYVPLTVVASFKKVKAVVNSNAHLASILKNSSKLIVSEDGKKVKRQQPFTEQDVEELQSRIIVAENLPEDHCHQNLMKIFSSVGSVKTIRTCPPQNPGSGPSSVSRSTKADGMHFTNKLHAFVEYESVEIAEKAVMELNDEANWRNGLRVRLMLKRSSKGARGKKGNDGAEEEEVSTSEQPNEKPVDDIPRQQHDVHFNDPSAEETHTEKEGVQRKGRGRGGRGKGRGRGHPHHNSGRGNHLVGNPSSANNSTAATPEPSTVKQAPPPGPRMPDGTRGFAMGRGKPVPATAA